MLVLCILILFAGSNDGIQTKVEQNIYEGIEEHTRSPFIQQANKFALPSECYCEPDIEK